MSLFAQRSDTSEFRRRFRWIAMFMALAFIGILVRLFQLQAVDFDENHAIALGNIVRKTPLATTRGVIRDRNQKVLARNRASYNLYVSPRKIDMATTWQKLSEYVGIQQEEKVRLEELLSRRRAEQEANKKDQQILLKEDISRDALGIIRDHATELPGVEVVPVPVRYYPYGDVGAHVLGYMAEVDGDKLPKLRPAGYIEGDRIGASGIEREWENFLRGTRGWERILVDSRGRKRKSEAAPDLGDDAKTEPIPGRDLRLTIDADLQKAADKAMRGEQAGGVAVVEVRTGRILALYSKPSYNPSDLSGASGKQVIRDAFRKIYSDPLKPALDKTVAGAYPPGSTFKPFTALAALEKGLINPRISINCHGFLQFGRGKPFGCTHVHGPTTLHRAIAESCNVYFWTLVADYGVEQDLIAEMGQQFGFGQRTGVGINAEVTGRMPTRAWMTLHNHGVYQRGFGLNAAIGQGATTASVLQLALAYVALANGGTLYEPQLVRAVETSDGTTVQEFTPHVRRQIEIAPENVRLIHSALNAGVNEEGGTARKARIEGVDMAGKTGTAQVGGHRVVRGEEAERLEYLKKDHAWFAGYSPTDAPEIAVVVLVEHGGTGGKHAAPVAFQVVAAWNEIEGKNAKPTDKKKPAKPAKPIKRGVR
ncbi:MAG: penicillin-binding protein 2 [Polyangiaceae bacterium]